MANSWELSDLNKNLRLSLIGLQHFERNGFVPKIDAVGNGHITVGSEVDATTQWCVLPRNYIGKSYWFVLPNVSDVEAKAVLSVLESAVVPPQLDFIVHL